MWTCPYCGNHTGMPFHDMNLKGMLCMHPDCGRFDQMNDQRYTEEAHPEAETGSLA